MNDLPPLDYDQLAPTRDFLQDVARLIGKLQQLFLPDNPQDWHRGLMIGPAGLMSQPFIVKGQTIQALLDFNLGCLELDKTSWELKRMSAQQLQQELQYWLKAKGLDQVLETPVLVTQQPQLDLQQAGDLAVVLNWAEDQFEVVKRSIKTGKTSPVLLFPHHFDLALTWFPRSDSDQISLGFSTGDGDVTEPYFYLTASPEPADFKKTTWPAPAYWNAQGFNGGVLKYGDLQTAAEPAKLVGDFWQATTTKLV